MRVSALAVRFIIDPLSLVNIAVCMHEFSLPVCFVVAPLAFVPRAVWPQLGSKPISHAHQPLPSEHSSILKSEWSLRDSSILIHLLTLV